MYLNVGGFFIQYEINNKNKYREMSGIAKTETEEWGTSKKAYGVCFRQTRRQPI